MSNRQFLDLDPKEQTGKHCTEVEENNRMHIVARTGKKPRLI